MKLKQRKLSKLWLGCMLLMILTYSSCNKDNAFTNSDGDFDPSTVQFRGSETLLEVEYEIELYTKITALNGEEELSLLDRIMESPDVDRQKVKMKLGHDGTFSYTMESMNPRNPIPYQHQTLPNNLPTPHKTVVENGEMKLYDIEGNFLYANELEVPASPELANQIIAQGENYGESVVNQAIMGMQSSLFIENLEEFLNEAQENDFEVQELEGNIVSVRMPIHASGMAASEDVAVNLIDRERNLLLATQIYDASNNIKGGMMMRYAEGDEPILKGYKQVVNDILPSGAEARMETYASIDKLKFSVRL